MGELPHQTRIFTRREGHVPGRSLIASVKVWSSNASVLRAGLWGSLRGHRAGAACLRSRSGGSKWCARSVVPHPRERSHPRYASRLDAFLCGSKFSVALIEMLRHGYLPERSAGTPHGMQHDSQLSGQSDLRLARSRSLGNRFGPITKAGTTEVPAVDCVRSLV